MSRLESFVRKETENFTRPAYTLKCDIRKFFDSIDHDILFSLIKSRITDRHLLEVVRKIIESFHTAPGKGLPLGNVTSQLFSNVYLNELDQYVKLVLQVKYYLRYCDDFVFVDKSKEILQGYVENIDIFLNNKLKIAMHPRKIVMKKVHNGTDILGYVVLPYYRILRTKTRRRMLKKLRKMDRSEMMKSLPSYLGMISHCKGYQIKQEIYGIFDL